MKNRLVRIEGAKKAGALGTFTGTAYTGKAMRVAGWYDPIVIDLEGLRFRPDQQHPVFRQHDPEQITGHTTSVRIDQKNGVVIGGVFSGQQQHVDKVVIPARNGFEWQLSLGADPLRIENLDAGKEASVNGRRVTGPLTISRETQLGEVSFVPLGADDGTSARVSAKHQAYLIACASPAAGSTAQPHSEQPSARDIVKAAMREARADEELLAQAQARIDRRRSRRTFTGGVHALCVPYSRMTSLNWPGLGPTLGHPLVFSPGAFSESVRAIMAGNQRCDLTLGHELDMVLGEARHFALTDADDGVHIRFRRRSMLMSLLRAMPSARRLSVGPILHEHHVSRDNRGAYFVCTRAEIGHIAIVEHAGFQGTGFTP